MNPASLVSPTGVAVRAADLAAIAARVRAIRVRTAEWDESLHPRDEQGQFSSGGGGGSSSGGRQSPKVDTLLRGWTEGTYEWKQMQHAARAVLEGETRTSYTCYDCKGDDATRFDEAKLLIDSIEATAPLDQPLYRGIIADPGDFPVGAEFSESLTSWTGKEELASSFASGAYLEVPEFGGVSTHGRQVVLVFEAAGAKGLPVSPHTNEPVLKDADEYLTSGRYKVTATAEKGGTTYVNVTRVGKAESTISTHETVNYYGKTITVPDAKQPGRAKV